MPAAVAAAAVAVAVVAAAAAVDDGDAVAADVDVGAGAVAVDVPGRAVAAFGQSMPNNVVQRQCYRSHRTQDQARTNARAIQTKIKYSSSSHQPNRKHKLYPRTHAFPTKSQHILNTLFPTNHLLYGQSTTKTKCHSLSTITWIPNNSDPTPPSLTHLQTTHTGVSAPNLFTYIKHRTGLLAIPGACVGLACASCWPADAENTVAFDLIAGEEELEPL